MKEVLRHILEKKRVYRQLPLFEWLRNEQLSPRQRLAFYPCMAPFVLGFRDLNEHVLREERPGDLFQDMVNARTLENDPHAAWYLEDFAKLGFDATLRGGEWMSFLWGEETAQGRVLVSRLTALISGTTSIERLAIIEAIEETGNVLFGSMLPLSKVLEEQLDEQLHYYGPFHFELEADNAAASARKPLAGIALIDSERARCKWMVDEVFTAFAAWTHELLRYALAHPTPAHRDYTVRSSATWRIGGETAMDSEPVLKSG